MTSRLGTGKSFKLFYSVEIPPIVNIPSIEVHFRTSVITLHLFLRGFSLLSFLRLNTEYMYTVDGTCIL